MPGKRRLSVDLPEDVYELVTGYAASNGVGLGVKAELVKDGRIAGMIWLNIKQNFFVFKLLKPFILIVSTYY